MMATKEKNEYLKNGVLYRNDLRVGKDGMNSIERGNKKMYSPDAAVGVDGLTTSGWYVTARRRHEGGFYELGGLHEIQTAALLYYLLYWMGFDNEERLKSIRESLGLRGFKLNPHYNRHGCFYDY